MKTLLIATGLLVLVLIGCTGARPDSPGFVDGLGARARRGKLLYASQNCARCHGADGRASTHHAMFTSNNPTNLRRANQYKRGFTEAAITQTLRTGVPGTSMPAYPHLSEEDLLSLAEYLRAWQRDSEKTVSEK